MTHVKIGQPFVHLYLRWLFRYVLFNYIILHQFYFVEMACNENMIKNVATEVTSNCVTQNVNVDIEFVSFLIELLLLNPKYGKQFAKTFNRRKLEHFVNECVDMFVCELILLL